LKNYVVQIIDNKKISDRLFDLTLLCPELAKEAKAGQFVHIKCGGETLLRRPISICDTNEDTLRLIIEIKGEGTKVLSKIQKGKSLEVIGPVGNGFSDIDFSQKVVFVGGGLGCVPLLMHAKKYGKNALILAGFRDKENIFLTQDYEKYGCKVIVATDDGSFGHHGYVTELLKKELENGCKTVFACGPHVMLKGVAQLTQSEDVFCEISTEERMGCGIGACLVCACETKYGFKHVCKDGPVFNSKNLVF